MDESEVLKLLRELRSYDRRFIFQGGSAYAISIAEEVERLRYVNRTLAETIDRLMAENSLLQSAQGMLKAEADSSRTDAKRYRYLRNAPCLEHNMMVASMTRKEDDDFFMDHISGAKLDEAVDKARGES